MQWDVPQSSHSSSGFRVLIRRIRRRWALTLPLVATDDTVNSVILVSHFYAPFFLHHFLFPCLQNVTMTHFLQPPCGGGGTQTKRPFSPHAIVLPASCSQTTFTFLLWLGCLFGNPWRPARCSCPWELDPNGLTEFKHKVLLWSWEASIVPLRAPPLVQPCYCTTHRAQLPASRLL